MVRKERLKSKTVEANNLIYRIIVYSGPMKLKLLGKLISAVGISGSEEKVRAIIESEIKGYVDETHVDKLGNLIAHKWGQRPKVMLAAHMDEIGLMVKRIDNKGHIYCSAIGGVNPLVALGDRVHIHTKRGVVHGVLTIPKVSDGETIKKMPKIEDLIVDTGLTRDQLVKRGVEIGCYISPHQTMGFLGSEEIISGKALDNRIGCFILIELAKRLRNVQNEIFYVFTVQEEFGLYGALTSAYKIEPDWAIVVDVTNTDEFSEHPTKRLGKGPCLTIKDADTITSKCLNNWIRDIAQKKMIKLQLEVTDVGTTDAYSISVTKGGVPSTVIGVPIRNLETTISIAHKRDISDTIELLTELLRKPPVKCLV